MTAPPFRYFGGKQQLARHIVPLLPNHDHYVEPYAGGLGVLLAKPRSRQETVNDLDGDLMTFWQVLRDNPDALTFLCAMTPHSRAEHRAAWDELPDEPLERARRVWVRLTQNHGSQCHHRSGWMHAKGPNVGKSIPSYLAAYIGRIAPCAARLLGVSLENRPALDVISDYGSHESVLLYVDPPYFGPRAAGYAIEMQDEGDHVDLLRALRECRAQVVLSGYPNALYDQHLGDWRRVEIGTMTSQGGARAERTEVIWANCEIAQPDLFGEVSA